jgi:hypothetical protein
MCACAVLAADCPAGKYRNATMTDCAACPATGSEAASDKASCGKYVLGWKTRPSALSHRVVQGP